MKQLQQRNRKQIQACREELNEKEVFLSKAYHRVLWKLAKALGGYDKVSLTLDYQEQQEENIAYTNGKNIYLNTINPITRSCATREERMESHEGLIAHECGHIRYTDFNRRGIYIGGFERGLVYPSPPQTRTAADKKAWKEICEYLETGNIVAKTVIKKTAAYISNILEDVYIEERMCREYPGSVRYSIQKNALLLLSDIPTETERNSMQSSEMTIMLDLFLRYARAGKTKEESQYSRKYLTCLNGCRRQINQSVYSRNPDIRYHVTNYLMLKIWKYIKKQIEITTRDFKQLIGQLSEQQLKEKVDEYLKKKVLTIVLSENRIEERKMAKPIEGWNGKLDGEAVQKLLDEQDSGETEKLIPENAPDLSGEKEEDGPEDVWNVGKQMPQILNEAAMDKFMKHEEEKLQEKRKQDLNSANKNSMHSQCEMRIERAIDIPPETEAAYEQMKPEIKKLSKRLCQSVEEVLIRQEGGKLSGLYMGKRLSRGELYRRDGKVFEKNIMPEEGFSIAFAVLVDVSGSMGVDHRIDYARKAGLVLYDFCQMLSIPVMVYGHSTERIKVMNHLERVKIDVYADFNSVDQRDQLRITQMEAGGCNRDGAAIRFVAQQLSRRQEETKILILISDGSPNADGYGGDVAKQDLQEAKQELEKQGIILFAAAIGDDKPQIEAIYKEAFLNISDLKTMPMKLAGLLTKYIK